MSFGIMDWLIVALLVMMICGWVVDIFINLKKDPWIWSGGKFDLIWPYDKVQHRYIYDTEYDIGSGHKRVLKFMQIFEIVNGHKTVIVTWTRKDGFVQAPYTNVDKAAWERAVFLINRQYKDYLFHMQRKGRV